MFSFPDIKAAEDVTARIREIVRYLRYSSKERRLVSTALLVAAVAWLVQSDQAKQLGGSIFDDWQKITGYTSLLLYVFAGLLLIWASFLFWNQLSPPPPKNDAVRPTAVKGPGLFNALY
jgi:hypothetical protein